MAMFVAAFEVSHHGSSYRSQSTGKAVVADLVQQLALNAKIDAQPNATNDLLLPPNALRVCAEQRKMVSIYLELYQTGAAIRAECWWCRKNVLVFPDSVEEDERNDIYSLVRNH